MMLFHHMQQANFLKVLFSKYSMLMLFRQLRMDCQQKLTVYLKLSLSWLPWRFGERRGNVVASTVVA